jgi:hypothetical protein
VIDREQAAGALRRLGPGGVIAVFAGVALIALTFCQWYGPQESGPNSWLMLLDLFNGGTAWEKLGAIPYFLALTGLISIVVALLRLSGTRWRPRIALGAVLGIFGLIAAGLIAMRIIWPPGVDQIESIPMEKNVELAVFLALVAALGLAFGGWWTARHEAKPAMPDLESLP